MEQARHEATLKVAGRMTEAMRIEIRSLASLYSGLMTLCQLRHLGLLRCGDSARIEPRLGELPGKGGIAGETLRLVELY